QRRRPISFSELTDDNEPLALRDESPLPQEWAERQETRELVQRALAELPAGYRAVLSLRYNDELSYEDIARILDLPLNTVRTHLFRAKAQLRLLLADWLKDNGHGLPKHLPTDRRVSRRKPDAG
ncbi:MAG: sigma-70 family RNA polymerase sigma factor, partial [Chloroflexi bacterium]|nr:sigma-70 family RNA polymerase sigma factor [Chloroflexota bacterium]